MKICVNLWLTSCLVCGVSLGGDAAKADAAAKRAAELAEKKEAEFATKYGSDYVTYRDARQAEAKGDDAAAIELYGRVSDGLMGRACTVYRAGCLIRLNRLKEANDLLERFRKDLPEGTYWLDASLLLARVRFLQANGSSDAFPKVRQPLNEALEAYPKIYAAWQEAEKQRQNQPLLLQLLADDTPAAKAQADFDVEGAQVAPGDRRWPGPETIFSRETCAWYLPWTKCRLHAMQMFLNVSLNLSAAAAREQAALMATFPMQDANLQAYGQRLGRGIPAKGWLFPADVAQRFKAQDNLLRYGAFLVAMGESRNALPVFTTVLAATGKVAASDDERAAASLGQLAALYQLHRWDDADKLLRDNAKLLAKAHLDTQANLLAQLPW